MIFEGPGQGSQLFLENIPFRPDWEKVVTPIVDLLEQRNDVNQKQIALRGISFGGELTPRAAAFEHRIAALVADPGSMSAWVNYPPVIQDITKLGTPELVSAAWNNDIVPASTPEAGVQPQEVARDLHRWPPTMPRRRARSPRTGRRSPTPSSATTSYDVVAKIKCPTLVTQYEGDTFFTDEGRKLFEALQVKKKDFVEFTAVDGAQYHCGPMAPQLVNETCWDWLDDVFVR